MHQVYLTQQPDYMTTSSQQPDLRRLSSVLEQLNDSLTYRRAAHGRTTWERVGQFLNALLRFSQRKCFDPRDRIYAISNIFLGDEQSIIRPDYAKSVEEVYHDIVSLFVQKHIGHQRERGKAEPIADSLNETYIKRLSTILALVGTEERAAQPSALKRRPTWVPDFHRLSYRSRCKHECYSRIAPDTVGDSFRKS